MTLGVAPDESFLSVQHACVRMPTSAACLLPRVRRRPCVLKNCQVESLNSDLQAWSAPLKFYPFKQTARFQEPHLPADKPLFVGLSSAALKLEATAFIGPGSMPVSVRHKVDLRLAKRAQLLSLKNLFNRAERAPDMKGKHDSYLNRPLIH